MYVFSIMCVVGSKERKGSFCSAMLSKRMWQRKARNKKGKFNNLFGCIGKPYRLNYKTEFSLQAAWKASVGCNTSIKDNEKYFVLHIVYLLVLAFAGFSSSSLGISVRTITPIFVPQKRDKVHQILKEHISLTCIINNHETYDTCI